MESVVRPSSDQPASGDPLWVRLLYRYGIPGALALYFAYSMTNSFSSKLDAMADLSKAHSSLSILSGQEQRESSIRQETYLRLLCVNTAKTDEAKNRCLTVR